VVQFDPATSLRSLPFAFTYQPVRDIVDAEGFVIVASEEAGQGRGTFVSYMPSGAVVDDHAHNSVPYGAAYSPARDRLYFGDQWGDGHYVDIDPVTGRFGITTDSFFSDPSVQLSPPIQFANNGAEVFFGSGWICDANLSTVLRSFPTASKFLVTTPNRLTTISSSYPDTLVRRYFGGTEGGTDLVPGQPQLLLDAGANALVVTIVPAVPNTIGRDPPSFHFVDLWKDP
jgi:hypothetical protein